MKTALRSVLRTLFTLAISVFLILAFVLVITQVLGLLLAQPGMIDGAYEVLATPSIIAAILVGLVGYAYYNTLGEGQGASD